MLAEMGNKAFRLGNVATDAYGDIFAFGSSCSIRSRSFAASAPMCSECAFEPYCGAEPVYHMATRGNYVGRKPEDPGFLWPKYGDLSRVNPVKDACRSRAAHIFRRWVAR